jgi:hypothetical protein
MADQKVKIVIIRAELYRDFTINLLHKIYDYYLDVKTLSNSDDMCNHYNWCYNEVCKGFEKEKIIFSDNADLKSYFYSFYIHHVYKTDGRTDKDSIDIHKLDKFWRGIFNYKNQKNSNDMNILIEIYNIFNKSLNPKKEILEKV